MTPDDAPAPYDPDRCSPCRGTGTLISGAGGEPKNVPCPWCEGSGRRIPEHDAQAARRGDEAPAPAAEAD